VESTTNGNGKIEEQKIQINECDNDEEKKVKIEKDIKIVDISSTPKESPKLTKNQKKHLRKKLKKQQQKSTKQ